MYSYIAPIVTDVTDLSRGWINVFLLVFGIGSVFGSWAAGMLADWNIELSLLGGFAATVVVLAAFYFAAGVTVPALVLVFFVGSLGSVVAINLQMRLMDAAGEAQMLGAALNHSALNIANGLGAWLGGVVISAGHGYRATSLVGIALASAGLLIFAIGLATDRRTRVPQESVTR
jgi:DHA1 family inner membrane transport protein